MSDLVQFRLADDPPQSFGDPPMPCLRPAFVVKRWAGSNLANLVIACDGDRDDAKLASLGLSRYFGEGPFCWATSIGEGVGVGQWRETP